jgi:N-acetylglucosamine kinase-like BadF-type ATPase
VTVVLGVEAGGSHCHAVVAGMDGSVLGAGANTSSGNWEDVGIGAAGGALRACVREALDMANVSPRETRGSVFALAGIDFAIDEGRLGGVPAGLELGGRTRVMNDAFAALRAGTSRGYGVVVAAGTGSIVAGRNEEGTEARSLGLGPMFGDSGSASEVSEAGVGAVAAAFLGRGPDTMLTETMCARTGARTVEEFLEGAARGRIVSSTFAPLVVAAADAGDEPARAILARAGESLGDTAAFVIRRLGMERSAFDLVLAGGLLRAGNRILSAALEGRITQCAPRARLVLLDAPPVVGSALLALEVVGAPADEGVRDRMVGAARQLIVGADG